MDIVGPWRNLPLGEVVKLLSEQALKRDPEGKGINFIINSHIDAAGGTATSAIDPGTGLPPASGDSSEPDMAQQVAIQVDPPLYSLRLADVLDVIVKVADHPIKFSVERLRRRFLVEGA